MKNPLEVSHRYDDIIDLPHYTSPIRPRMPLRDRAAQFAPFATLLATEPPSGSRPFHEDSKTNLTEKEDAVYQPYIRFQKVCVNLYLLLE